jgi:hypothetical protein
VLWCSHTDDAPRAKSSHETESMGIFFDNASGVLQICNGLMPENRHPAWILAALD